MPPVGQLWAGSPLMNINDGIWSEFQAQLQEHAEIVDLPVDRLRNSSYSHNVILEVSQTLRRLHVPIRRAHAGGMFAADRVGKSRFARVVSPVTAICPPYEVAPCATRPTSSEPENALGVNMRHLLQIVPGERLIL